MVSALFNLQCNRRSEALDWLMTRRSLEIERVLKRHPMVDHLASVIRTILPQPIAEEIEPHIAALGVVEHNHEKRQRNYE